MILDILQTAAAKGGEVLCRYFQSEFSVSQKTSLQNLVTQADIESQKVIQQTIVDLMIQEGYNKEDVGFIGEEDLYSPAKYTFVIDPLDGTNNFASGWDHFAVSLAVFEEGKLLSGVIYQPTSNTYYTALKGKGAFKLQNNKSTPLKIVPQDFGSSILVSYISSNLEMRETLFKFFNSILPSIRGIRALGSVASDITYLVENKASIIIDGRAYLWDIAAGVLILEESGGISIDHTGTKIELDLKDPYKKYFYLGCIPEHLPEIVKHLG